VSEIEVEPGQADEVIARAVTLLALIDPKALGARTLSDRIKVPQSAVRALADAVEAMAPGIVDRVRASTGYELLVSAFESVSRTPEVPHDA